MTTVPVSEPRTREEMIARVKLANERTRRPAKYVAPKRRPYWFEMITDPRDLRQPLKVREEVKRRKLDALVARMKAPRFLTPRERYAAAISAAEREHGVTLEEMRGRGKTARVVEARRTLAHTLSADFGLSSVQIARILVRDHTSVLSLLGRTKQSRRKA